MKLNKLWRKRALGVLAAGAMIGTLAACGNDSEDGNGDGGGGGAAGAPWILGTTDAVTSVDPAGSYDFGSWNIQYNIFQQLMTVPANGTDPVPDAADCAYDDPQTITCTLKDGLTFSNGDELTSSDVLFSFQRNIEIADPNGSSVLLGSISNGDEKNPGLADGAIETPDDSTVVFHLNQPDQTFMQILTSATTSIVDEETFPADDKLADDDTENMIGSGSFVLSQYKAGEQAVFEANESYTGDKTPQSSQVFVQYFNDAAPLKTAVESGQVDIAWRTLSPTDLNSIEENGKAEVIRGNGSEFRYWVWQFSTEAGKNKAIRQSVAQLIDRQAISDNAYDGSVTPAYSIVPPGFAGQKDSFKEKYGEPDVDAAKGILEAAGVKTPVKLKLGYPPEHYGPNTVDEANELADQLNSSGLFDVTVDDAAWEEYQTIYKEGAYDLFILGWYPDFLDADNYLSPFVRDGGFFANGYSNEKVNQLLDQEIGETDDAARAEQIGQLQDIVAEDVPLIPSWNGQNVAVANSAMEGVKDTLDPTYIFRFWMINKNG
ncbi:MAG TPA: ABC transporter substrate-binding protein [Nocardioides sp.]|uniref:ABC transporter substrate-binding protein n=1 Tax=Nocardioides sp. TaxID=35761 RepID=UPI002BA941B7|nr:ABC transporter substrate-binding protein [Nocardioides sp.]HQR25740.1 ABC transporter substrate-binding protein [Nocardioides sp.]